MTPPRLTKNIVSPPPVKRINMFFLPRLTISDRLPGQSLSALPGRMPRVPGRRDLRGTDTTMSKRMATQAWPWHPRSRVDTLNGMQA